MLARIGARTVLHSFRTRVGMRSGPVALLQSRLSSNFLTPLTLMYERNIEYHVFAKLSMRGWLIDS